MYLEFCKLYARFMNFAQDIVWDTQQEQNNADDLIFNEKKDAKKVYKRFIEMLRYYQMVKVLKVDYGDDDLLIECDKLVNLIDEVIAYIQDGNIH